MLLDGLGPTRKKKANAKMNGATSAASSETSVEKIIAEVASILKGREEKNDARWKALFQKSRQEDRA